MDDNLPRNDGSLSDLYYTDLPRYEMLVKMGVIKERVAKFMTVKEITADALKILQHRLRDGR